MSPSFLHTCPAFPSPPPHQKEVGLQAAGPLGNLSPTVHLVLGQFALKNSLQVKREMPAKLQSVLDSQPCRLSVLPGDRTLDLPAGTTGHMWKRQLCGSGSCFLAGAIRHRTPAFSYKGGHMYGYLRTNVKLIQSRNLRFYS